MVALVVLGVVVAVFFFALLFLGLMPSASVTGMYNRYFGSERRRSKEEGRRG